MSSEPDVERSKWRDKPSRGRSCACPIWDDLAKGRHKEAVSKVLGLATSRYDEWVAGAG
jgi:hypothetical protein